jgi:hypothetical protein
MRDNPLSTAGGVFVEAARLGGLEVHDHLVFHRKLHREIARFRAAQNAIDIGGGATPRV